MSGLYRKHEAAGEIAKKSMKKVKYSVSLCCFERQYEYGNICSLSHITELSLQSEVSGMHLESTNDFAN